MFHHVRKLRRCSDAFEKLTALYSLLHFLELLLYTKGGKNRSAVIKFTILQSSQRTLATSFFLPAFRWNGYLWCLRTNIASFRCMRKASLCEKVAIFGWDRNSATPERLLLNIMYCLLPSSTFWAGRLAGRLVCSKAVRQSYNINLTLLVPQNGVFPTPF